jgi:glycine hydroxymethyltransferase
MKHSFPQDTFIHGLIDAEWHRQQSEISLIASENYTSPEILAATGSILTNKYAEGTPGKRYYGGCEIVDAIEQCAIDRAKELFGVDHANVQPHSGSSANMAAYMTLIKPGEAILGMSLAAGGHLTHGHSVNFSGALYNAIHYGVDHESGLINYEEVERIAQKSRPQVIVAGASAYARIIDFARFKAIADSVGATLLVDMAHIAGLVAAGIHPSPAPYADCITSTTHKTLRGPRGGIILSQKKYHVAIDKAIMPGMQGGPLMHVIAAKALCFFDALQKPFIDYQKAVVENAQLFAQLLAKRGYTIVTGGTDTHLFIVDLRNKQITGLQAEKTLEEAGIIVSRSCIPGDPQKPWITSGIRIGTPAITTRGMGHDAINEIADALDTAISQKNDPTALKALRGRMKELAAAYRIPR